MKFSGQAALITGSTKGIGAAIARRFAAEGVRVVVTGRNAARGKAIAASIVQQGGKAIFTPGDVSIRDSVRQIFASARSAFGEVEILVNNAGIYETRPFRETTEEQWDRIYRINVKGTYYCCQEALEPMIAMKKGVILNMTSVAAKTGGIMPVSAYAASKAAVTSLTKSLARELAPFGIRVNALSPGIIRTEMTTSFGDSKIPDIPLGRLGEIDEVAAAAAFLCSAEASYITGEIMDINGGQYMD